MSASIPLSALSVPISPVLASAAPRHTVLADWLAWQEQLHPRAIDLGLERVRTLIQRLALVRPAPTVITVGGTNGKGSTVAFLEAILSAAGYRVGCYTSPHLLRYNERLRIAGEEVSDAQWCAAFAQIDGVRGELSLTYFEFATLAALLMMQQHQVDVAVLEVGLGGRLDATNAIDSDCAVVTSIALDHCEWLGADRDSIGYEKAGIFRAQRPAVCADPQPPPRLLNHAEQLGTHLYCYGRDYGYQRTERGWRWFASDHGWHDLPVPRLAGEHQLANAAAALMAVYTLPLPVSNAAITQGVLQAFIPGRLQIDPGAVEWVYDVAHNPHAAGALASALLQRPVAGRTHIVLGVLADKDAVGIAQALAVLHPLWYLAGLEGSRGQSGEQLMQQLVNVGIEGEMTAFPGVAEACAAGAQTALAGDRIVVCGSFHTVAGGKCSARQTDLLYPRGCRANQQSAA